MTTELVGAPFHTPADGGTAVWHLGMLLTFLATTEATGGRCWVKEIVAPRGAATPRHVHSREDEAFYVLDGEVSLYLGHDVIRATAGSFAWGARTIPHAFCVESETAKMLVAGVPGGFDRFFFDTGTQASAHALPPPAIAPPDLETIVAAARDHGVDVIGPPPAPATTTPPG